MSGLQGKFTPLLPLILPIIEKCKNKDQLLSQKFEKTICLAAIEKGAVMCLSDFTVSIQATKSGKQDQKPHPFNKFRSNYYFVLDRSWIALNARYEYLTQPQDYPHPYQPHFHFRSNYQEYRQQKKMMSYRVDCEVINIHRWGLKIVNIGATGYYGVVLGEKFVQNVANISCILYEKTVKQTMEAFRLFDLRKNLKEEVDKKVPWSLAYYCKDLELNPKAKKRLANIISVDTHKKILNFDSNKRKNYVNFGAMQGINCLQYPVDQKQICQQKLMMMNWSNIKALFNSKKSKTAEKQGAEEESSDSLWSSDEDSYEQNNPNVAEEAEGNQDSESSDSEDPLRNLYMKQFQNIRIV